MHSIMKTLNTPETYILGWWIVTSGDSLTHLIKLLLPLHFLFFLLMKLSFFWSLILGFFFPDLPLLFIPSQFPAVFQCLFYLHWINSPILHSSFKILIQSVFKSWNLMPKIKKIYFIRFTLFSVFRHPNLSALTHSTQNLQTDNFLK
jgi:hypothetical protein